MTLTEFVGSGDGGMIGLSESGVLTCEAGGMNSKFSESREDVLVKSVNMLEVYSVAKVVAGEVLFLGMKRPEESQA